MVRPFLLLVKVIILANDLFTLTENSDVVAASDLEDKNKFVISSVPRMN